MRRYGKQHNRRSIITMCLLLVMCTGCSLLASGGSSDFLTVFSGDSASYDGHSWSPDGHWLAAESSTIDSFALFNRSGQLVNNLNLGCYLGGGVEDIAWLPDGRLSCIIKKQLPMLGIYTLDQSGQVINKTPIPVPIEPQAVVSAIGWSPQKLWLATIASSRVGSIHIPALYISDFTGHLLFGPMLVDANTLAWSHDGKALALVLNNHADGNGDIELLHLQQTRTGTPTVTSTIQLAAGTASEENIAWSPSDHWLVCHFGSYESDDYLYLLATDGSGQRVKLTSSATDGQLGYPSWSPDGKQLIVTRASDGALLSLDIAALLKEKGVAP